MPPSIRSLRAVVPLVTVGVILLLVSLLVVARDLRFSRNEAESEVLAFTEASALAIQFAPNAAIDQYLAKLVKHPAISMATVYSRNGERTTKRREATSASPLTEWMIPSRSEPVLACRAIGSSTLCLEGDGGYYQRRLAALLIPHELLLAATVTLLLVAIVLARGSNQRQLGELTKTVRVATEESNYSLRATEGKGQTGALAHTINKLLEQMHQRDLTLRRRTTELESVNQELDAFSYAVSHDLRSPLASVDGFSQALGDFYGDRLDESGKEYLRWIRDAVVQMQNLVAGLLQMSRFTRSEINRSRIDLSAIAEKIAQSLQHANPSRDIGFRIEPGLLVDGDERLLQAVLENLLSNAFKFTKKRESAMITIGSSIEHGHRVFFVKDNGAGFDASQAARMFTAFQRLHSQSEFEGTGIGLSTVKRIIERHGGAIWADGEIDNGATFFFTIGDAATPADREEAGEMTRA